MRRWLGPLVVLLVCAAAVHLAVLRFRTGPHHDPGHGHAGGSRGGAAPIYRAAARDLRRPKAWCAPRPISTMPCARYDLRNPGTRVTVRMGAWPDYQSAVILRCAHRQFRDLAR